MVASTSPTASKDADKANPEIETHKFCFAWISFFKKMKNRKSRNK